ncbi:MAG: glyoxalase [SAR86 cluster bacterium]|uniref:Glyoxalase n=1 Tax=SAR86 cluster bacterium TaxID=2030880 RepID=A0A2A5ABX8_9GAMM|nr:MAG: glyoxalase [SAR86 cluster bacterium]
MHKSKLAGFIIDCNTEDLQGAAEFWSSALGMKTKQFSGEEGEKYVRLMDSSGDLHIEVQSVNHQSRIHLDIETDNIEAEVARLKALGAKEISRVSSWCVMEAPTGQRFCIVNKCTKSFEDDASEW